MQRRIMSILAVLLVAAGIAAPAAQACSRVTWLGPDGVVITGRTMDWPYSFNSHLYAIPRGLTQDGAGGVTSLTWAGKYGAIEVAGTTDPNGPIDGVFDGMNETGLVANLLYLGEADFGPAPADNRPPPCTCRSTTPAATPPSSNTSTARSSCTTAGSTR